MEDFEVPVFLAGIFNVCPTRIISFVIPLACLSCAIVNPYFLEIDERVSPDFTLCVVAAGAEAVFDVVVEFCFC